MARIAAALLTLTTIDNGISSRPPERILAKHA
jgi:hypothetical protein